MRMCLNRNVLIGLGTAALVLFLVAPSAFAAALPILVFAACPLAMLVMMRAMSGEDARDTTGPHGAAPVDRDEIESELRNLELRRRTLAAQLDSVDGQASGDHPTPLAQP